MTEVDNYVDYEEVAEIDAQDCEVEMEDCIFEGDGVSLEYYDNDNEDVPLVPKIEKEVNYIIRGFRRISSGIVIIIHGVERIARAILGVVKKIF